LHLPIRVALCIFFFFSSRRRHTRFSRDWSSDVCSSDLNWSLSDIPEEGVLEAEGVTTTTGDYDVTTTFTVRSTFDQQISNPYGYAIYRDASGNIIGGSTGYLNFVPAGGSTAAEITSWDVIPNIASTEVYVDVGFIS